jgi:hypothetical protein
MELPTFYFIKNRRGGTVNELLKAITDSHARKVTHDDSSIQCQKEKIKKYYLIG